MDLKVHLLAARHDLNNVSNIRVDLVCFVYVMYRHKV